MICYNSTCKRKEHKSRFPSHKTRDLFEQFDWLVSGGDLAGLLSFATFPLFDRKYELI